MTRSFGFILPAILRVHNPRYGARFCKTYSITGTRHLDGKSIPNLLEFKGDMPDESYGGMLEKVFAYRSARTSLLKDRKILASWNGLMIAAYARAARIFRCDAFLETAKKAAGFIKMSLSDENGRKNVLFYDGQAVGEGKLDDYAFMSWGNLELYDATYDPIYMEDAIRSAGHIVERFSDKEKGGYFMYADDSEKLINRPKEVYDGAMPSGNSVTAYVMCRLEELTGSKTWIELSRKQLEYLAGSVSEYPTGHSFALLAMQKKLYPAKELVCVLSPHVAVEDIKEYLEDLKSRGEITILVKTPENMDQLQAVAPFVESYPIAGEGVDYYLCENKICHRPVKNLSELL